MQQTTVTKHVELVVACVAELSRVPSKSTSWKSVEEMMRVGRRVVVTEGARCVDCPICAILFDFMQELRQKANILIIIELCCVVSKTSGTLHSRISCLSPCIHQF